jgi:hypothetical protein
MSQLVKTKRQANFKGFNRFGAFKGLVEQKNVVFNSFLCKLGLFGTRGLLKRSFHWRFKMAHACQKRPNLHTNSSKNCYYRIHIFYRIGTYYIKEVTSIIEVFISVVQS